MAVEPQQKAPALRRLIRSKGAVLLVVLVAIWVALPFVPEETGLQFGWVYRVFFTVMALLVGLFFWFLGRESIRTPERPASVAASVAAVFVVTVGLLVAVGVLYPQFPVPQAKKSPAQQQQAAERGRELFLSPSVGCFRCHAIAGKGGTRGPDLTQVASTASGRVAGLKARDYLLEKLKAGSTYDVKVPKYAPIMPRFEALVSQQQLQDLVAYLMTLKGAPAEEVEDGESGD